MKSWKEKLFDNDTNLLIPIFESIIKEGEMEGYDDIPDDDRQEEMESMLNFILDEYPYIAHNYEIIGEASAFSSLKEYLTFILQNNKFIGTNEEAPQEVVDLVKSHGGELWEMVMKQLGKGPTLSDKAKKFLSKNPTLIGTVNGVRYYEHPTMGDESPLIELGKDGKVRKSDHWELPSIHEQ